MAMSEVILLERVPHLGQMGELVSVRPGYARNFLLPQGKAIRATKANKERFEADKAKLEADNKAKRAEAEKKAASLKDFSVVLIRQAGESGNLYGSVSARDIADAVAKKSVAVTRQQVFLDTPIKHLGLSPARVQLHPEVILDITVNVARSEEEADRQAKGEVIIAEKKEEGVLSDLQDANAAEDEAMFEAPAVES